MVNRVKTLVVTRPVGAQAAVPRRIVDNFPARVDRGERFASWLVVLPVISLMIAGLLIMMLSTFVKAPPRQPGPSSSDAHEKVQAALVDLPGSEESDVGEAMARRGPAFSRCRWA